MTRLKLADIERWALSKPKDETVGVPLSPTGCPVARYLTEFHPVGGLVWYVGANHAQLCRSVPRLMEGETVEQELIPNDVYVLQRMIDANAGMMKQGTHVQLTASDVCTLIKVVRAEIRDPGYQWMLSVRALDRQPIKPKRPGRRA